MLGANKQFCCVKAQTGYRQARLGYQGIELFGGRENLSLDCDHLSFLDHVHQLDSMQSAAGRVEGFEAEHGSNDSFNRPVVLLDEIIQVFTLTNLDGLTSFLLERLKGGGVGSAFIDGDLIRETMLPRRLLEET